ncbi:MAG TPA: ATP-binding protein [Gallionella sp.]|nr:ATP-binding protein [Gallionella sp.]
MSQAEQQTARRQLPDSRAQPFAALFEKPGIWVFVFVFSVLTISLAVTYHLWQKEQRDAQNDIQEIFNGKTDQAANTFKQLFQRYEDVLQATDGLFAASQEVSTGEFRRFFASLRLKEKFPEIREIGFVAAIRDTRIPGIRQAMLTLHEPADAIQPPVLGRDLFRDRIRREALIYAATTGGLGISNKIRLPDETEAEAQPGYRLYWPIYRDGVVPQKKRDRENNLLGWSFVSVDMEAVLRNFERDNNQVAIEIYDGDDMLSAAHPAANSKDRVGGDSDIAMMSATRRIDLGGYTWTLVAHALPATMAVAGNNHSAMIARIGVVSSLVLAFFSWLLLRGTQRVLIQQNALRQQQEALRLSESQLQAVMDTAPVGIWWMDETGRYRFINKAFSAALGIPEERFLKAASLHDILDPVMAEQCVRSDQACLQGDGVHHSRETMRLADGNLHQFAVTKVKLLDSTGKLSGLIGVSVDISEQQVREDALQDLLRTKSAFLANMSHEIRTPMNSVLGMTRLALEIAQPGKLHDYLDKIRESGELLLRIIDDILDLSKIEADKLEIEMTDFDLNALVSGIVNLLGERARLKGIALGVECPADLPRLRGDVVRIRQVLINLADNAIKFTAQGSVTIRVSASGNERGIDLRFEVRDSGIGMTETEMERLFQPFQQADMSTTRQYGGSGLGLSICKRLVELMGGKIGVSSQPGYGSLFWFSLQLARSPCTVAQTQDAPCKTGVDLSSLRGAKILLAENNPFNQEVAIEFLSKTGAVVQVAGNGIEALKWLRREVFDCVLMDVQMPEMDGMEATRQIRHNPAWAELPIIAMTANAFEEDRQQCLAAGMNDFISKPVQPEQLYAVIVRWLHNAQPPAAALPPQPVAPQTESADLDLADLYERLEHDRARAGDFVRRFLKMMREDMTTVESAVRDNNSEAIKHWAHHWRSPAHMVGAYRFALLCRQLESSPERASDILAELRQAADTAEAKLDAALADLA